jgi:hypothetical protein
MTPFEYITVLISIILGLGITQILTGIGDIIHQWNRIKIYWPHALWILLVFVMHIHEWWYTYELKRHEQWHLLSFLFLILYPILLFVLSRILFPFGAMDTDVDMKAFYFGNYRKFFLLVSLIVVLATAQDVVLAGYSVGSQLPKLIIPAVLGLVAITKITHELLHQVIVLVLLAIFIASMALLDYVIG